MTSRLSNASQTPPFSCLALFRGRGGNRKVDGEGAKQTQTKINHPHARVRAYIFFSLSFYIIYLFIYLGCRKLHFLSAKNCTSWVQNLHLSYKTCTCQVQNLHLPTPPSAKSAPSIWKRLYLLTNAPQTPRGVSRTPHTTHNLSCLPLRREVAPKVTEGEKPIQRDLSHHTFSLFTLNF